MDKFTLPVKMPERRLYRRLQKTTGWRLPALARVQVFRSAASYVDRTLRGDKTADLPVQESTKYELVIKLKTAKALGLTISPSVLVRADEVIE